jgi:hypothetical protein
MNQVYYKTDIRTIRQAVRSKYAWPGGYPMFLIMNDNGCLCMDCAKKEWKLISRSIKYSSDSQWEAIAVEVNWEDNSLQCDNCNKNIESAYGEKQ